MLSDFGSKSLERSRPSTGKAAFVEAKKCSIPVRAYLLSTLPRTHAMQSNVKYDGPECTSMARDSRRHNGGRILVAVAVAGDATGSF